MSLIHSVEFQGFGDPISLRETTDVRVDFRAGSVMFPLMDATMMSFRDGFQTSLADRVLARQSALRELIRLAGSTIELELVSKLRGKRGVIADMSFGEYFA